MRPKLCLTNTYQHTLGNWSTSCKPRTRDGSDLLQRHLRSLSHLLEITVGTWDVKS